MTTFVPAQPFPPGEYLKDELEARGWTHEDLGEITGISRRQIINLIQGKSAITTDTAQTIGAAFGQEPETWMNLQIAYELAVAAKETRDVEKRAKLFDKLPLRELWRRGWLPKTKNTDDLERAVCAFLCIARIDDEPTLSVAERKSTSYRFTNAAQLAWYYRVRQVGESAPVSCKYKQSHWEAGVADLRKLAAYPQDARRVPRVLADMGIRLVLVQHLKKTKIDGVALWLDSTSPVVGLSLRYDRLDNFWHSLMHELIHIRHKDASPVDEDLGAATEQSIPEIEKRANREATNCLVDTTKLKSFISRCGPMYYESRVVQFSQRQGVHPGIVVGQLQHLDELNYAQFAKFRAKIADHIRGHAVTDGWGSSLNLE